MSKNKQKLELTWIGKENRTKLEPRILLEDPSKSYHAEHRVSDNDIYDNMLIYGDNLLALKALEAEYTGKVKCVFIDPPYNTGSAFAHYDDGVEHSLWLSLMRDRLELLRRLLSENGSLWITIDDNEAHYLKVLCDEIFGRSNFVASLCWQKIHSIKNDAKIISTNHDTILLYAKNIDLVELHLLPRTEAMDKRYKNPDNDPRGPWQSGDLVANEHREGGNYEVTGPTGKKFTVPYDKHWVYSKENMENLIADNRIYFGKNLTAFPRKKRFLSEVQQGRKADTWWDSSEVGHNQEAKREARQFNGEDVFGTPKPERLMNRIIHLASKPGDLVLDSFLGSGTTAAVAHKMGRRWIGVELGKHCHTHCIPRMKKVIDGEDQGGISKSVNWQGGGGFRYYSLAPTLIVEDEWGNPVINTEYNSTMLAEAMCKLHGFTYKPNDEFYWMQGYSTETDFIYVTTQFMSAAMLEKISEEVGPNRSLLVCCNAYKVKAGRFDNLTLKKIPKSVLNKCEWGHDDYSLEIQNLPKAPKRPIEELEEKPKKQRTKEQRRQEATLFEV